jgi:hypothetical protein
MTKKKNADFKYQFTGTFDPNFSPFDPVLIEKKRYLEGILPQLERLKEEVKKNKKKEAKKPRNF